jgi:hypothetical protein
VWLTPRAAVMRSRLEMFAIVGRLLAASASEVYELDLRNVCRLHQVLCIAPTLTCLMEQCQSLRVLSLSRIEMDEDQIRALRNQATYCQSPGASAEALAGILGRNQCLGIATSTI